MTLIILILLLFLCAKWIFIALAFPWVSLRFQYLRHKSMIRKILAVPGHFLESITQGGASRFVILNIGYIPSVSFRLMLYRMLAIDAAKHVVIHYKFEVRMPHMLSIGRGTIVGDNALFNCSSGLTIGKNVNFSSNVSVYTGQHDHRDKYFGRTERSMKPVSIADRAWIGSNVIILPGVTIGEGAVCCAGCVVTKDVEPFTVVAGVPAHPVGTRPQDLCYEFDGTSCWFY